MKECSERGRVSKDSNYAISTNLNATHVYVDARPPRLKLKGESFKEVIIRLAKRRSLTDCAGLWEDNL